MEIRIHQGISMGQYNIVGIATRYRLDGPGIETQRRQDFLNTSRISLLPIHHPVQWVVDLFPVGKATGLWS
jgi:hypothetical protein